MRILFGRGSLAQPFYDKNVYGILCNTITYSHKKCY